MDLQPYKQQLAQINTVLASTPEGSDRDELLCLKQNIEELIALSHNEENSEKQNTEKDQFQDEYAMFMAEMAQEGAVEHPPTTSKSPQNTKNYKEIEGKMFRAPHAHHFGQTVYHNCMVSAVPDEDIPLDEDFEVEVLFLNPTHKEMLPCPYFFNADKDCTFGEKCKFSHGETKLFSSLEDYVEPKFENLSIGSTVLAKQKNNLWSRAKIKHISKDKCLVSFENKANETEDIVFKNILPLENSNNLENSSDLSENSCSEDEDTEDQIKEEIINMSLLNTPGSECLGNWEKHTKGIGSRLMQKMGYIVGTGLGKDALGRVDPVTAVILPPGKSLDYCMRLREKHGGDRDLFSAEKKMKRLQKKAQKRSEKMYRNSEPKKDLFNFINTNLNTSKLGEIEEKHNKRKFKEDLKTNTERELNVQNFVIHEDMKKCEKNIETLKIALTRHIKDPDGEPYKKIMQKIGLEQEEMRKMEKKMTSIRNEQQIRSDKKKLTIF